MWYVVQDMVSQSSEVPPSADVVESTATVVDVPLEHIEVTTKDGLPTQIWGNEKSWIVFV